ncbi:MAG: alpha-1,4-glucan--maltose-1-phosphate maltosyltransferase [Bacteroidia bacterium]
MKATVAKARAVIERISPQIDEGAFAIKRVPGEQVIVKASIFGDGHDIVRGVLLHKAKKEKKWTECPMLEIENDDWQGHFMTSTPGEYEYAVAAWIDHPLTWHHGFLKKVEAGENVALELKIGADFLRKIAKKSSGADKQYCLETAQILESDEHYIEAIAIAKDQRMEDMLEAIPLRENESISQSLALVVERKKAAFSTWYEFFPRSASQDPKRTGTFQDCIKLLPHVSGLGFDTLYFPPIHPIGVSHRKGKNNSTTSKPGEPGSPWAIGSSLGGHKAINPELGTLNDFRALVKEAKKQGIEIALDLAYQCSPDHPYVKEHPQWFKWRPDGTVQYAENPPKKYQDVLPINFETEDWKNLWEELKSVIEYWIGEGISIFRVDNPHTKPFVFWQWLMAEMRNDHPEVIFLSEAFTRPKIMAKLAKVGFQQSYSYFTWRQTGAEIKEYVEELTQTELREYFRANFWPNTPDILPYYLQNTDYSQSALRFVLAATLSSNYGMYAPVFELLVNEPMPGKEEYFNSEKYEAVHWDWNSPSKMRELIAKVNQIRRENPAFHTTFNITFCNTDNENLLAYLKTDESGSILTVVNMDPLHKQSGWVQLPLNVLNAHEGQSLSLLDLMDDSRYTWNRQWNYIELDPRLMPVHIFKVKIQN